MKKLDNPSQEELFLLWCNDATAHGYIKKVHLNLKPNTIYEGLKTEYSDTKILYKGTKRERTKTVIKSKTILESVTYKPDAVIEWSDKAINVLCTPIITTALFPIKNTYFYAHSNSGGSTFSPIEVKSPPGSGGKNTSDASFRILQKWYWKECGIFINKVYNYPTGWSGEKENHKMKNSAPYLWPSTFTPSRYFWTDKLTKLRTIPNFRVKTIKEFQDDRKI